MMTDVSYDALLLGGWALPPALYRPLTEFLEKELPLKLRVFDYGFFPDASATGTEPDGKTENSPMNVPDLSSFFSASGNARETKKTILIAHSMGTLIACLEILKSRSTERVWTRPAALLLFNPFLSFVRSPGTNGAGWDPERVESMKRNLLRRPESLLRAFYKNCASPSSCAIAVPERCSVAALAKGLDLLAHLDASAYAEQAPECPVLCFSGAASDQVLTAGMQDVLERLPGLRIHYFPDGGHLLPLTHAEESAAIIRDFLVSLADAEKVPDLHPAREHFSR